MAVIRNEPERVEDRKRGVALGNDFVSKTQNKNQTVSSKQQACQGQKNVLRPTVDIQLPV